VLPVSPRPSEAYTAMPPKWASGCGNEVISADDRVVSIEQHNAAHHAPASPTENHYSRRLAGRVHALVMLRMLESPPAFITTASSEAIRLDRQNG
jgi:hypothetical protein